MTGETEKKQAPWWIQAIFTGFVLWAFGSIASFATIVTFLATAGVNLSHVGVGPYLMVLGLMLLVAAVTFVIVIRLTLSVALSVGVGQWELINVLMAKVYGGNVRFTAINVGTVPTMLYKMGTYPPPNDKLRSRMRYAVGRFLLWLCVSKEYLDYFKANRSGQPWEAAP